MRVLGNLFSTTVIDWTYDNLNRLIGEDFDQDLASISGNESTDDYTDAYTLDEVGNRLIKTHDAGRHGTIDQTTTSSYMTHSGLDDLLTQETVTDSGGTVTPRPCSNDGFDGGACWRFGFTASVAIGCRGDEAGFPARQVHCF